MSDTEPITDVNEEGTSVEATDITLLDRIQALEPAFSEWERLTNLDVLERHVEVKTAIVSILSLKHHFQVGPPGVAKSLLVRRLFARVGEFSPDDYFQWLLTKYTTPEEVFGPPSLKALEQDHYRRNTAHKLPVARIAFMDEIFKANSSILNAFLMVMNEREFQNNGEDPHIPLMSMFAASNELPHGEELGALWDRLHFRHEVRPIQDGGNFVGMLKNRPEKDPAPVITIGQIEEAQALVEQVHIPGDVFDAMKALRDTLRKTYNIEPTERRWVECLPIIRATAFLNGRDQAEINDMRLLKHVLWYSIDDQKTVSAAVLDLADPIEKGAQDLLEQIEALGVNLDEAIEHSDNSKKLAQTAVEIHSKLQQAKTEMVELRSQAKTAGRKSETLDALKSRFKNISTKLYAEAFGVATPPAGAADIEDPDDE